MPKLSRVEFVAKRKHILRKTPLRRKKNSAESGITEVKTIQNNKIMNSKETFIFISESLLTYFSKDRFRQEPQTQKHCN